MKRLPLFFVLLCCALSLQAQEKPTPEPLQYPFDEIGTETPRGIYGEDDRIEVKDAEGVADYVRATAVMIPKKAIIGNKVFGETLRQILSRQYRSNNFDENVKFLDQPTCAQCTGFLIAPDILVTAGHCIKTINDSWEYVWVFDYTNELRHNDFFGYIEINPENVFEVKKVLSADLSGNYPNKIDYSILQLNRKTDRIPYRFRTSGNVSQNGNVATIGSPTGLPLKFVKDSYVVQNNATYWFKSNIDSFPGNSGGPVFNINGFIEGIHVRGAVENINGYYTGDYKYDTSCNCIKTVEFNSIENTAGAQAHKITTLPGDIIRKAIYENIEYAIINNDNERLNSWLVYKWIVNSDYTKNRGKLEKVALYTDNFYALENILKLSKIPLTSEEEQLIIEKAILKNKLEFLDYFLSEGYSIDNVRLSGLTPVQYAVTYENIELLDVLATYDVNFNLKYDNNNNLLHIAAKKGNLQIIKTLVANGVSAKAKNKNGYYPEKVAKRAKHKGVFKYLKNARKGKL